VPITVFQAGKCHEFSVSPTDRPCSEPNTGPHEGGWGKSFPPAGHGAEPRKKKTLPRPTLARFLWMENRLPSRPLCGGLGRCGRCRVTFLSPPPPPSPSERELLTSAELAAGVRLACLHSPVDGMILGVTAEFQAPDTFRAFSFCGVPPRAPLGEMISPSPPHCWGNEKDLSQIFSKSKCSLPSEFPRNGARPALFQPGAALPAGLRLLVDLGTTSLVWRVEDDNGTVLDEGSLLNPQMDAGADVMARLSEAADVAGAGWMQERVIRVLHHLVWAQGEQGRSLSVIGLAANPAMTALLLGLDTASLRAAPYCLPPGLESSHKGLWLLPDLPPLWVAPALGPFVGGDISAGLAALPDQPLPALLADMGTNGECVLVPEQGPLLATSVPLGPALEGMGLACGGLAGPGGIIAFHPSPNGLTAQTLDGGSIRHICGTGYLSLLRLLLDAGLVDADGHFVSSAPTCPTPLDFLRRKLAPTLRTDSHGVPFLPLPGELFLSARDVESLLHVKAAFSLAIERLLEHAGLKPSDLCRIWLAGALGFHAPLEAVERLGLVPRAVAGRVEAVGNTALHGLALLLRCPDRRKRLMRRLTGLRILDLASEPSFHQNFINHTHFA